MEYKNIIITGASKGIGYEMCLTFASQGHKVLAISRTEDALLKLTKLNKNISFLVLDISDEKSLEHISGFVLKNWKQVDCLIHNAGLLINKPFLKTSMQDFVDIFKVNVFAVASLTKLMIPYLKKGSHVITISSMGGIQGSLKFPGLAAYSSSKGALITLTELMAEEFKASQIAFNCLALGAVQTEMLAEAFPGYKAPTTAQEMANYIVNFALNGHKYFNGKVLQVSLSTP